MKALLALASFVALAGLCGCSTREAPNCSKQPAADQLDAAEKAALADAMARYGGRCERKDYQCDISLIRNSRRDIVVTIASVYPDRDNGRCLQAPGDQDLVAYRPDGTFISRVMSL